MKYSTELRDLICVNGYEFLSFAKKMGKSLSNKYQQNFLDSTKQSATDAHETGSKRATQKTAEKIVDLFRNNIADRITEIASKGTACKLVTSAKKRRNISSNGDTQKKDICHLKERLQ